ncbi:hypothetical protein IQ251_12780 [Saccharopolyspora sp. HNM0983]|uniref:DUF4878 domain-containing protein n=1 Tax=Saccharopolyspora montiporae TaxID=2781240 RepID=A0A929G077_9PSEU|nr:hypothetical protein [Saccharopolyspora sp. HNM0983]MBE9375320.1 hypothetical protein [Saccharopolyspora sp. HNM0983]
MTSPPQGPGQEGSDEPREPRDDQPQAGASGEPQDGSAAAAGDGAGESSAEDAGAADRTSSEDSSAETAGRSGEHVAGAEEPTTVHDLSATQKFSAQHGNGPGDQAGHPAAQDPATSGEPGRKKSKKPAVIIGVVAAAVIILGGAGAAAYVFLGGNSAQEAAERYVELSSRETQDPKSVHAEDYRAVVCSQAMPQIEQVQQEKDQFLQQAGPEELEQLKQVKTTLKGVEENGDTGTAKIETSMPEVEPQSVDLKLVKEEGDWKLCG